MDLCADPDQPLLDRLRHGDPAAFSQVWQRHRARLYTFALRLSRQPAVAEDLVQDTWLRLAQHAHRLEPDTRLLAWLYTVTRRLYLDYRRKHLGWLRILAERAFDGGDEPPSPYLQAAAADTGRQLEAALLALPLGAREVLLLVAVDEVPYAEAAQILGISEVALRQRLSRARALLAQRLLGADFSGDDGPPARKS